MNASIPWTNITAIGAGYNHVIGIRKDGTLVAVGVFDANREDDYGQCNVGSIQY